MEPSPRPRRLHLRISGRVQGVGFRFFARSEAMRLGLTGWVRNSDDGSVEVEVQGPPDALERYIEALREGPPMSRVDAISRSEVPAMDREVAFVVTY